jgi:hypothetical protein
MRFVTSVFSAAMIEYFKDIVATTRSVWHLIESNLMEFNLINFVHYLERDQTNYGRQIINAL